MSSITEIDKNFVIKTNIEKTDLTFHSVLSAPFRVYGAKYENGKFRRMPEAAASRVSRAVEILHVHTAGARVRFKTTSPYVAISAKMSEISKMPHFAFSGSAGFDLYVDGAHIGTYLPPLDVTDGYEGIIELGSAELREIQINFPLYSAVHSLHIGLSSTAKICEASEYKITKPIVYYGSSITHGGCASRPGASYEAVVSRRLDADFINLGFSGSALGEPEIAEYISGLDMSAFVLDYDHNAPTPEHLAKTHEVMFKKVREANPALPIIIASRPKFVLNEEEIIRLGIIKRTYENAIASGDKNVYFLDGATLMSLCGSEGTVEGGHPTDLGFFSMAYAFSRVLEKVL